MKFTSEEELLDCIRTGVDLYSPSLELYMFLYNDAGAVCTYSIAHDHALELVQKDEYWGAYLGPGGSIYDDPEGEFENEWDADDWISVSREQASWVDENANNVVCYIPEKRVLIFMQEGSGCNFDNEDMMPTWIIRRTGMMETISSKIIRSMRIPTSSWSMMAEI